jgi:hypothetical protein
MSCTKQVFSFHYTLPFISRARTHTHPHTMAVWSCRGVGPPPKPYQPEQPPRDLPARVNTATYHYDKASSFEREKYNPQRPYEKKTIGSDTDNDNNKQQAIDSNLFQEGKRRRRWCRQRLHIFTFVLHAYVQRRFDPFIIRIQHHDTFMTKIMRAFIF